MRRSQPERLEAYFHRLEGKSEMKVVCMDLATHYRSLVRKIISSQFQRCSIRVVVELDR